MAKEISPLTLALNDLPESKRLTQDEYNRRKEQLLQARQKTAPEAVENTPAPDEGK